MESGSIKCHGESRKIRTEVKLDLLRCKLLEGFPGGSEKESAYNAVAAGDMDSVPESGRSPGGGHSNPLQYAYLENPMDRGAWQATVHRVAKSQTRLKQLNLAQHKSL